MEHLLAKLVKISMKLIIGVLLALMIYGEWKKGYFKGVASYRKKLSFKTCRGVFFAFLFLTLFLIPFDPFFLDTIQSFGRQVPQIFTFGQWINRNIHFWMILISLYFLCVVCKKKGGATQVFDAILASAGAGLVCHLLKFIFLRARPDSGHSPFSFLNAGGLWDNIKQFQSFPSGDVALISGAASYFFFAVKKLSLRPFRWVVFLFPLISALARVNGDRHWLSDTVASLGVALMVGRLIWDYRKSVLATCSP